MTMKNGLTRDDFDPEHVLGILKKDILLGFTDLTRLLEEACHALIGERTTLDDLVTDLERLTARFRTSEKNDDFPAGD